MKETCGGDYMNFPGASCTSCPIMIEMCLPIYEKDVYISNKKKKKKSDFDRLQHFCGK